ncbi:MAG: dephospho-CoA kinase [Dehalococcoidia bacterium]|nr:dephospho-CoA kinase [Dehalococcoidia bacterium]
MPVGWWDKETSTMKVIGLTGGIGTGKSTVSQTLADQGAVVINADLVGHQAYLPHQNVWQDVVDAFGKDILNEKDEVDRGKLGPLVFGDPANLDKLNKIVHPWMYRTMEKMLQEERQKGTKTVVLEAAILIEASWTPLVDEVWVTDASQEAVIERLVARNNLTLEQIKARIASQMPAEERRKHAAVIVDTNCTIDEVRLKVKELWTKAIE